KACSCTMPPERTRFPAMNTFIGTRHIQAAPIWATRMTCEPATATAPALPYADDLCTPPISGIGKDTRAIGSPGSSIVAHNPAKRTSAAMVRRSVWIVAPSKTAAYRIGPRRHPPSWCAHNPAWHISFCSDQYAQPYETSIIISGVAKDLGTSALCRLLWSDSISEFFNR